jgi:ubiquinone/menaquinone biosynthesis C-methylase UbiE
MIQKFFSFKKKITNLLQTNYDLGIFHLNQHNINDSILRLKIVLFFNPKHFSAKYYLAICFYIKNQSQKAKRLLNEIIQADKNLKAPHYLLNFFEDLSLPEELDKNLTKEFYTSLMNVNEDLSFVDLTQAHSKLVSMITLHLADSEKKINILDVGCGSGQFFSLLKTHIKIAKSIGIDFTERSIDTVAKHELYTQTICQDFQDFAVTTNELFDLVILDSTLNYYKNLTKQLAYTKKILAKNGLLALIIEQSPNDITVTFNHILSNFCYSKDYIVTTLNNLNLKLLKIELCKLNTKNLYLCICVKE